MSPQRTRVIYFSQCRGFLQAPSMPWLLQVPVGVWLCCCLGQESTYQLLSLKCALQWVCTVFKTINPITLTVFSKPCSLCTLLSQELLCMRGDAWAHSSRLFSCDFLFLCPDALLGLATLCDLKKNIYIYFYKFRNTTCKSQLLIKYIPQVVCCIWLHLPPCLKALWDGDCVVWQCCALWHCHLWASLPTFAAVFFFDSQAAPAMKNVGERILVRWKMIRRNNDQILLTKFMLRLHF